MNYSRNTFAGSAPLKGLETVTANSSEHTWRPDFGLLSACPSKT